MKKYLMTGVAALAICAAFTSCSSKEELYNPEAISGMNKEKVIENYNARFLAYVGGSIAPDQDWGFGTAGTRGTFSNGNEWAANDRTECMYRVPPKLTDDQIKIVRIYFQSVKDPGYENPGWTNYFIQQVYKGGSNPGPNSTEKYKAADNNTDIIGSDHMDHLAAVDGNFVDHNKNFNNGDCGEYKNVLNFKGTLTTVEETYPVNSGDEYRHADKINLMTESTTKSFGYYNSNSSIRRTEYTGLVSWSTIKTWANANGHSGEADCLDDGWNRSFMGFDFEMLVDEEVYSYTKYDANGNIVYNGEYDHKVPNYFSVELPNGNEDVWNGTTYVKANTVGEVVTDQYGGKKLYPYFPGTTEKVGLLSSNSNEYAGTRDPDWNGTDWEYYEGSTKHLSIEKMTPALQANKLPLNQYNWVKIGGTADHYYSDWIVTLTEATKYTTTPPPPTRNYTIRVLAEDLTFANSVSGVAVTESDAGADFDFNDVVFDVAHVTGGTADENGTWIRLMAAGGTLPLYIGTVPEGNEVHKLFKVSETTMVNTYNGRHGEKTPVEFKYSNNQVIAKNIAITVIKDGIEFTLSAERGEPASKIAVDLTAKPNFEWADERQSIKERYPLFAKWAEEGQNKISEWWNPISAN